ncbi:MAG: hypothetical protein J6W38_01165 [Prevotella sp.]|nr:hypothetical protein [Prevotella sp.]
MTRYLHILTECWRRTPWQVVLLLFAVPFLIRNLLLLMVADDFSYAFIWNGNDLSNLANTFVWDSCSCPLFTAAIKMADSNTSKEGSEHLGLHLINNLVENISYKYMYGLNIFLIKI